MRIFDDSWLQARHNRTGSTGEALDPKVYPMVYSSKPAIATYRPDPPPPGDRAAWQRARQALCSLSERSKATHDVPLCEILRRVEMIYKYSGRHTDVQITGGETTRSS